MPPKATKPKLAGASSVPKAKSVPSSNRAHGSTPAAAKSKKPKEQAMETIVSRDESLHEELQAMEARATEAEARAEAAEAKVRTLEKAFAEQANMEEKLRAEISRLEQLLGRATAGPPTSAIAILPAPAPSDGLSGLAALDALSTSAPAAAPAPAAGISDPPATEPAMAPEASAPASTPVATPEAASVTTAPAATPPPQPYRVVIELGDAGDDQDVAAGLVVKVQLDKPPEG